MNKRNTRKLEVEKELRGALSKGELFLHYQPKIRLNPSGVTGVEALVRWNSSRFGSVPPTEFIPIAEETGFIIFIGEWVLREACAQTKA